MNENVGEIIETPRSHGGKEIVYVVKFDNVPTEILRLGYFDYEYIHEYHLYHLKFWSENKDELKSLKDSKKYNI